MRAKRRQKTMNLSKFNPINKLTTLKLGKKTRLAIGLGALLVVAFAGFAFWSNRASAAEYMTAKVERGNLRNTVTATGTLQAVTTVQVGSQAPEIISALNPNLNSAVKKGKELKSAFTAE